MCTQGFTYQGGCLARKSTADTRVECTCGTATIPQQPEVVYVDRVVEKVVKVDLTPERLKELEEQAAAERAALEYVSSSQPSSPCT